MFLVLGDERIPFIWFWPRGKSGCIVITHDVESAAGRERSSELMDLDDSYGVKASFQVIPQGRYEVTSQYLDSIRDRGFEIAIQDFNHDGKLFDERSEFLRRAALINEYARDWGAKGFRSGEYVNGFEPVGFTLAVITVDDVQSRSPKNLAA